MRKAAYYREKAEHCRTLAKLAYGPLADELLRLAREFDDEAEKAEKGSDKSC